MACLQAQHQYLHHLHYFITSYAAVIIANFSIVFASMAVLYWKVFRRIRHMRKTQGKIINAHLPILVHHSCTCHHSEQNETTPLYGATQAMILEGQKDAKKRVLLFLTVFSITGCVS